MLEVDDLSLIFKLILKFNNCLGQIIYLREKLTPEITTFKWFVNAPG